MLVLFRCLSRWPLWSLHALGAVFGWLAWMLSANYRHRFRAHAAQAGLRPAETRPAIAAAGRMVAELPFLWMRPAERPILPLVQWQGEALIDAALQRGKGVLFLTPHLGCFEVTAQAYAERYSARHGPITVLYRPARKAWLRELVDQARHRPGLRAAPATLAGVRQMMRALHQGQAVGLLPDQVPPEGLGVWAPFFDQPAYTMTLAARLARQTGATVLLAWGERRPWGRGYTVHVSALGETLPEQAESAALRINKAMEQLIRQCPGQYLWGYHRYKAPRRLAEAA